MMRRTLPILLIVLLTAASAVAQRPASGPPPNAPRQLTADEVARYVDALDGLATLGERPVVDPAEARGSGSGIVYEGPVRASLEARGFDASSFGEVNWLVVSAYASLVWDDRRAALTAKIGESDSPAEVERAIAALEPPPALADVPVANKRLVSVHRDRLAGLLGDD
jgi:hypothetical protein